MRIYIPTYGRSQNQQTLKALRAADIHPVLVVQAREAHLYDAYRDGRTGVLVLPVEIQTIAPTRQYILEHAGHSHFCMIDDDLEFFHRREDDQEKLRPITPEELRGAFEQMDLELFTHPHVGFAAREGANRNTTVHVDNTRIMRVLGYDGSVLLGYGVNFNRLEVMEDFDVALQLLRAGLPNRVLNLYAHNQGSSGADGGCSSFRTPELHARAARTLAGLHHPFVTVVEKTTKGAWGGGTRTDVRIQWKKAYESHR